MRKYEQHGDSHTKLYKTWLNIKSRCNNKNTEYYKNYGGRGIAICEEWQNDYLKFKEWALSNNYSEELTIDREDVNKNYCPENCRWITNLEQQRNRRDNINFTHDDKTLNILDWCELYGINRNTAYVRNFRGSSFDKIFDNKNNLDFTPKKVTCITTGEVFESIHNAARHYQVSPSDISRCCKNKRNYCGKDKTSGEKLQWKYI